MSTGLDSMSRSRLKVLDSFLQSLRLETAADEVVEESRRRARRIIQDKLGVASRKRPLLVIVAGGTNVGKSTVCNLLAGRRVSAVSALARGTRSPVVCGRGVGDETLLSGVHALLTEGDAGTGEPDEPTMFLVHAPFPPEGCCLIDSPDMDSDHEPNRDWAWRLLDAADAVILVVTPEKYHDAAVTSFLREAKELDRTLAAVMNKSEGEEAFQDFLRSVWRPVAGDAPAAEIPRLKDLSGEGIPVRQTVNEWCAGVSQIKATAVDGSAKVLRRELHALSELAARQERWLAELHQAMTDALDEAVHSYRRQISSERFEELDRVFRRLLREFRIPVVDDFYDGVRSVGAVIGGRLRGLVSSEDTRSARRERERQRVEHACRSLVVSLSRQMDGVPLVFRHHGMAWRSAVPVTPDRVQLGAFMESVDRDVERWVAEESAAIARVIGSRPGVRRSLVAVKSGLQIGAGVLGVVLTGGLDVSDLAVAPVVERLTALFLERGLGYPYFVRSRARLVAVRTGALRTYLESLAAPLRGAIPAPDSSLVSRLQNAGAEVPGARELLR